MRSTTLLSASLLLTLAACTGKEVRQETAGVDRTEERDRERANTDRGERATREQSESTADKGGDADGRAHSEPETVAEAPPPPPEKAAEAGGQLESLGYLGDLEEAGPPEDYDAYDDLASADEPMEVLAVERRGGRALDGLSGLATGRDYKSSVSKKKADPAPAQPVEMGVTGGTHSVVVDLEPIEEEKEQQAQQQRNSEDYVHYGVNDMTLVDKDRFSTFSIDVDTASYSIARRKLQEGWMPPTASVRVEEFVNALHYDYDAPRAGTNDGAPFAVHMEAAPNPWQQNHHVLRVGVQGAEVDQDDRAPVHLTFLVDTSGSMNSPDKLGLAKESLKFLVDGLGAEDTVAIATYAGASQVVLEPTSCTQKATLHAAIDSLSSGGGTHMDSGMNLAYEMASQSYLHGAENRVIVLSDGDANIGRTTHDQILATVKNYAEEGITLSTIGFGMGNYKDTMMEQLSNQGDGNYFYIDSMDEAHQVFGEDLAGTIQTIAKDVKIQVEFNPDAVTAYRLIGYENRDIADVDFRNDRVDAGEIGSGHAVTALYDVVLKDDAMSQELATVRVRAKKPGPDSPAVEWATVMNGELLRGEVEDTSDSFRLALATATFAELLRGSPYVAEISYRDVWALAKSADRGQDEDAELLNLIETAGTLSGETGPVAGR